MIGIDANVEFGTDRFANASDQLDVALLLDPAFQLDRLYSLGFGLHRLVHSFVNLHQPETVRDWYPLPYQAAQQLVRWNGKFFTGDVIERRIDGRLAVGIAFHRLVHQRMMNTKRTADAA